VTNQELEQALRELAVEVARLARRVEELERIDGLRADVDREQ
jgi:hypothetical protein